MRIKQIAAIIIASMLWLPFAAIVPTAEAAATVTVNDTFDNTEGNSGLNDWAATGGTAVTKPKGSDKAVHVVPTGSAEWASFKRTYDSAVTGKLLIRFDVNIADITQEKPLPRLWSDDNKVLANILVHDSKLQLNAKDTLIPLAGGDAIVNDQWYTVSIELDTAARQIAAWVGDKPADAVYYPFIEDGSSLKTVEYILNKADSKGIRLDNFMLVKMPAGTVKVNDEFNVPNVTPANWDKTVGGSITVTESTYLHAGVVADTTDAWPEVKRYFEANSLQGDVLLQYKFRLPNLSQYKIMPRLYGTGGEVGQIIFWPEADSSVNRLFLQGDNYLIPGSQNLVPNQWYDLSINVNTNTHTFTAWVGTKPEMLETRETKDAISDINAMVFIFQGRNGDTITDPYGIDIDDVKASVLSAEESVESELFDDGTYTSKWTNPAADTSLVSIGGGNYVHFAPSSTDAELKRTLPANTNGDLLFETDLLVPDVTKPKMLPALMNGADKAAEILLVPGEGGSSLVLSGAESVAVAGAGNLAANQWVHLSIQANTVTQTVTAWLGDKPADPTGTHFKLDAELLTALSFALQGEDTAGIGIDNLKVTQLTAAPQSPGTIPTPVPADNGYSIGNVSVAKSANVVTVGGSHSGGADKAVSLLVKRPNGDMLDLRQKQSGNNGSFSFTVNTTGWPNGRYDIVVGGYRIAQPASANFVISPGYDNGNNNGNGNGNSNSNGFSVVVNADSLGKGQNGKVTVSISQGTTKVLLPANAAELLMGNKLEVRSNQAVITIDPKVIQDLIGALTGKLSANAQISLNIEPLTEQQVAKPDSMAVATLKLAGAAFNFELSVVDGGQTVGMASVFNAPVVLSVPYDDKQADEELLGVYYYNPASKQWDYIGGKADIAANTITVTLPHFSTYALMEYSVSYHDLPAAHWAHDAVRALAAKHIVKGMTDTDFVPKGKTTRAEFAALLARALDAKASGKPLPFSDVKETDWFHEDVAAAYESKIITGQTASRFAPNQTISRQEMAVMLVRAYMITHKSPDRAAVTSFKDGDQIASWATADIDMAVHIGLMQGTGNERFNPKASTIRAEAAVAIYRLLNSLS